MIAVASVGSVLLSFVVACGVAGKLENELNVYKRGEFLDFSIDF